MLKGVCSMPWALLARPSQAEQMEESQEVKFRRGFLASHRSRNPSVDFLSSASDGNLSCPFEVPTPCRSSTRVSYFLALPQATLMWCQSRVGRHCTELGCAWKAGMACRCKFHSCRFESVIACHHTSCIHSTSLSGPLP